MAVKGLKLPKKIQLWNWWPFHLYTALKCESTNQPCRALMAAIVLCGNNCHVVLYDMGPNFHTSSVLLTVYSIAEKFCFVFLLNALAFNTRHSDFNT